MTLVVTLLVLFVETGSLGDVSVTVAVSVKELVFVVGLITSEIVDALAVGTQPSCVVVSVPWYLND